MNRVPRILAFAGSLRKDSWNKKLVQISAEGARKAGADVTLIDLKDFPLPIFDQDMEDASGMPSEAQKLKDLWVEHDGLLIASPEYNSSITPVLKNVIDWVSRPSGPKDQNPMRAFSGKVVGLMAASPGALGGLRGLVHVRAILGNLNMLVLPGQKTIPKAHEAFGEDGNLKDLKQQQAVEAIGATLVETLKKLNG